MVLPLRLRSVRATPPRNLGRAVQYLRDNLREQLTLTALVQASGLDRADAAQAVPSLSGNGTAGLSRPAASARRPESLVPASRAECFRGGCKRRLRPSRPVLGCLQGRVRRTPVGHTTARTAAGGGPRDAAPTGLCFALSWPSRCHARKPWRNAWQAIDLVRAARDRISAKSPAPQFVCCRQSSPPTSALNLARYCLSGRVAHQGPRARVLLAMTDRQTHHHLWGDSFDGLVADLFSLQDAAVGGALRGALLAVMEAEAARLADGARGDAGRTRARLACPAVGLRRQRAKRPTADCRHGASDGDGPRRGSSSGLDRSQSGAGGSLFWGGEPLTLLARKPASITNVPPNSTTAIPW